MNVEKKSSMKIKYPIVKLRWYSISHQLSFRHSSASLTIADCKFSRNAHLYSCVSFSSLPKFEFIDDLSKQCFWYCKSAFGNTYVLWFCLGVFRVFIHSKIRYNYSVLSVFFAVHDNKAGLLHFFLLHKILFLSYEVAYTTIVPLNVLKRDFLSYFQTPCRGFNQFDAVYSLGLLKEHKNANLQNF